MDPIQEHAPHVMGAPQSQGVDEPFDDDNLFDFEDDDNLLDFEDDDNLFDFEADVGYEFPSFSDEEPVGDSSRFVYTGFLE
jgi:hypothetical protein